METRWGTGVSPPLAAGGRVYVDKKAFHMLT
jgi:hypothetical protein